MLALLKLSGEDTTSDDVELELTLVASVTPNPIKENESQETNPLVLNGLLDDIVQGKASGQGAEDPEERMIRDVADGIWDIKYSDQAIKTIRQLDPAQRAKVLKRLLWLSKGMDQLQFYSLSIVCFY